MTETVDGGYPAPILAPYDIVIHEVKKYIEKTAGAKKTLHPLYDSESTGTGGSGRRI